LPLHPYCRCAYAPYISEELTPSAGDMPTEEVKKSDEVKFKPYESEEEWRNGISASHKDAIHWWTDTGHRDIRAYQSGAKSMAEVDGMTPEALDFINEAMAKAPDYKGTVYRGLADLPNNVKNLYMKEGANVSFKAHSSTSMKLGEAENFVADPSGSLILKIHTKSGTDIHNLSEYSSELEVLLKKGTQFKTKGVVGETRGFKIVEWVEV